MSLSPVLCPWCGHEVADANGRGVQMLPRHPVDDGGALCPGSLRTVLFSVEYDPESGDETGRFKVEPQLPTTGEYRWESTYVEDSEWAVKHPRMPKLDEEPPVAYSYLIVKGRTGEGEPVAAEQWSNGAMRITRLDEDGKPTGDPIMTTGEIKLTLTDVDPDLVACLSGEPEPEPVRALDVNELSDETLCDDLGALADALSALGAEQGARLVAEGMERLLSYWRAYRRFVEISESFRVSPGQG